MSRKGYRTLIRVRWRTVEDVEPVLRFAAVSRMQGLLALLGTDDDSETPAGAWLIPASTPETMRSYLAQIAAGANARGWMMHVEGLWGWWVSHTEMGVVASRYEPVTGDDSGEGEYV